MLSTMLILCIENLLLAVAPEEIALHTTSYDCGIRRQNDIDIATYSLLETGSCNINEKKVNVTIILGQTVQKNKIKKIMVLQCKIKLHRQVQRCSLFGYLEPVENGIQEYLLDISREQCKKLHDTGFFVYNSNIIISDVKVNATTTRSLYLAGDAIDNSCNTGSFSDRFGTYSKVNVQGIFSITLTSYQAKLESETRQLLLRNGLSCDYDKMSCMDSANGLIIWERISTSDCMSEKLELIYMGNITQITETSNNITKITYFIDASEYLIMMEDKGSIDICYNKFIRTQSAETYVIPNAKNFLKSNHVTIDYTKYFDNKIDIIYKALDGEIKDIYLRTNKANCQNEISLIRENLEIARLNPELFAYTLMGPGYTAQLAGNVIHIIKCQPVEVKIEPYPKFCTLEIPIRYHNELLYMSLDSKIIIKHARKVACNKILPIKFSIDGTWIKFTPMLRLTKEPKILGPKPRDNFRPTELRDIEGRGLYSKEDINEYTKSINFPVERGIILDNTAQDIRDIKNSGIIDPEKNFFTAYIETHVHKYWNNFKDFGSISAAICASIAIIILIGLIINTILNALQIKKIVGCSFGLGAALLNSTTNKILRKAERTFEPEPDSTTNEVELTEIEIPCTSTTQNPIPKPRKKITRFLSPTLASRKIRNSFRKIKKRSIGTNVDLSEENEETSF